MSLDTEIERAVKFESLCISLDKSINTLQSNYYINKVCQAYSKMICLQDLCFAFYNNINLICKIDEYELLQQNPTLFDKYGIRFNTDSERWYDLSNFEDAEIFFKLFNVHELPHIQIQLEKHSSRFRPVDSVGFSENTIVIHDFNNNALKLVLVKHFSPPEYFVMGLEIILQYLITNKRDEELRKIEECLRYQEYIYKDLAIVKEVVYVSKVLNDENVDARIKLYVLNTLQVLLEEQNKLHKKMGIAPTITHVNLLT